MSEPKRHHYVPRCYQERFRDPVTKDLFRLDLTSGKSTRSNPKNTLFRKHLYTLKTPPEGFSTTYIEKTILAYLDQSFNDAIEGVATKDASNIDKQTLSLGLSFLLNRTPGKMHHFEDMARERTMRDVYDHIRADIEASDSNGGGLKPLSPRDITTSLQRIRLLDNWDAKQHVFLQVALMQAAQFEKRKWTFLRTTSDPFITSDNPVSLIKEYYDEEEHAEKYYVTPLSFEYCVKIHSVEGDMEFFDTGEAEINEINKALAYCADRLIVGSDEQQLQDLFRICKAMG